MECLGAQKCPMAAECFSELARARAADADVVITNHAMLAISAFEGLAVLPDYDVVVIDEAHELQDRVTGAVTGPLSVNMVQTAASAARKHCSVSVDALNQGAKALQRALEGVPTGLMARGLNEEQEAGDEPDRARPPAWSLSDSKPEANAPADGGRQMARSQADVPGRAMRPRCLK